MFRWSLLVFCFLAPFAHAAELEPLPLDPSLAGWQQLTGSWRVEDGVLIGTAPEGEMAWILHERELADVELEFEWRTPVPANGGLQFRSHWLPRMPLKEGETVEQAPKQMHGYQANIETRQRAASGRLVDESGRGALQEPAADASKTLKQKDWNTMRVVAAGPKIEIFMNGVLAVSIEDEGMLKGYLGFQVAPYDAGQGPAEVQYRNLRVKDLGREGSWQPLFNGTDLTGWKIYGSEVWEVADGAIVGKSGPKKLEGYLATDKSYEDVHVRGQFKMLGEGNYGLFYHSTITLREDGYPMIAGIQGEVDPIYPSKTGWLYESYKRGWLIEPAYDIPAAAALRPGDWNEIEIRVQGPRTTTWVNGVRAIDFTDPAPNLTQGSLALQLHTGGAEGIVWKELYNRE
jgi:hypothetical protein